MSQKTRAELLDEIETLLASGQPAKIKALQLRTVLIDFLESTPNSLDDWVAVPANSGATGTKGQKAYGVGYLYFCVDEDTWVQLPAITDF